MKGKKKTTAVKSVSEKEEYLMAELAKLRSERVLSEVSDKEIKAIEQVTRMKFIDIVSANRARELMFARSILYHCWEKQGYSVQVMAARLNRDRSTMVHLKNMHEIYLYNYPLYRYWFESYIALVQ
jgi:hypothetical protein